MYGSQAALKDIFPIGIVLGDFHGYHFKSLRETLAWSETKRFIHKGMTDDVDKVRELVVAGRASGERLCYSVHYIT